MVRLHTLLHDVVENGQTLKHRANERKIVIFGQQLPTLLGVTCWVRLHTVLHVVACSCELLCNVGSVCPTLLGHTHAHYTCSAGSLPSLIGVYPSHDALQVPTLFGVVASVCTPLLKQTQQFPTVLRPFSRGLTFTAPPFLSVCVWGWGFM